MKRLSLIGHPGLLIIAALLLSVWLKMGWDLFYPYDPIQIDKFTVDKTVVQSGERMCFQFEGEKFYNVPASVVLELTNGESIALMSYDANNPAGKVLRKRCFTIPHHTFPGKYQIRWTAIYQMNSFRTVRKTVKSDWIEVRK